VLLPIQSDLRFSERRGNVLGRSIADTPFPASRECHPIETLVVRGLKDGIDLPRDDRGGAGGQGEIWRVVHLNVWLTDANAPPSSTNATPVPWIANSLFDAAGDR
jgi:hypothetical protein